jgi:hypothetical protein
MIYDVGTESERCVEPSMREDLCRSDTWYPVPGYKKASGWEQDPHILNSEGELVAVFETMEDAERAAKAVNSQEGSNNE